MDPNFTVQDKVEFVTFCACFENCLTFLEGLISTGSDDIQYGLVINAALHEKIN
jgi:hypothetical protein